MKKFFKRKRNLRIVFEMPKHLIVDAGFTEREFASRISEKMSVYSRVMLSLYGD